MLTAKERFAQIEARRAVLLEVEVHRQRALSPSSEDDDEASGDKDGRDETIVPATQMHLSSIAERFKQIEARRAALFAEVLGQRALSPSSENNAPSSSCSVDADDGGFGEADDGGFGEADDGGFGECEDAGGANDLDNSDDDVQNDGDYDRCGTFGCQLPDRHTGLHSIAALHIRRRGSQPLRYGFGLQQLARKQQPGASMLRATLAAMHEAEAAADAEAQPQREEQEQREEEDEDGEQQQRLHLAGRKLLAGGIRKKLGAKRYGASVAEALGLQQREKIYGGSRYHRSDMWKDYKKQDGTLMFKRNEIIGGLAIPLGQRVRRILADRPELESPPSGLPANVRSARGFKPITKARIRNNETDGTRMPTLRHDKIPALHRRINNSVTSDMRAMRASCGDTQCPACRLPEHLQPSGPFIFYDDLIYWWNTCQGRCMAKGCYRKLTFTCARDEQDETNWTIQRGDNRINHLKSNILGVICRGCNSSIPKAACKNMPSNNSW
jgi:hypothetical protein